MEAKANSKVPAGTLDPISAKFDEVLSRGLTLKERFARMIGSVRESLAAGKYPESRRAAVEHRTLEYIQEITHGDIIARASVDTYVSITDKFCRDLWAFEQPVPVPSQREKWIRIVAERWRGNGPELDELFAVLKPDEQILQVDWQAATVAQPNGERRIITRQALRLRDRPSYSHKSPEAWIAQWDPIENPHEDAPDMGRVVFSERNA